jgi:bifunctional oligoribonuclease and PAP phosphatase NrnA
MKHQIILDRIIAAWQRSARILLTWAANFDGDALGCVLALAHFGRAQGKHMVIANESPASCLFAFATGGESIVQDLGDQKFDLIIICDTGSFKMLGSIYTNHVELFNNTQTINIDHHGSCYGDICWSTSGHEYASATMMVADFMQAIDAHLITPYIASSLLLWLYFDTECFRNLNTTPEALRFGAHMIELGADNAGLIRGLYQSTPACYFKLYGSVMQNIMSVAGGSGAIAIIQPEFFESCGVNPDWLGNEFVNHYLRSLAVDFVVLIKDVGNERRMSFRSKTESYNMRELAGLFGGGGHTMASGARTEFSAEKCVEVIMTKYIK